MSQLFSDDLDERRAVRVAERYAGLFAEDRVSMRRPTRAQIRNWLDAGAPRSACATGDESLVTEDSDSPAPVVAARLLLRCGRLADAAMVLTHPLADKPRSRADWAGILRDGNSSWFPAGAGPLSKRVAARTILGEALAWLFHCEHDVEDTQAGTLEQRRSLFGDVLLACASAKVDAWQLATEHCDKQYTTRLATRLLFDGQTNFLHEAAKAGSDLTVGSLLQHGGNPEWKNEVGQNILAAACRRVSLLAALDGNVGTTLHERLVAQWRTVVVLLLDHGRAHGVDLVRQCDFSGRDATAFLDDAARQCKDMAGRQWAQGEADWLRAVWIQADMRSDSARKAAAAAALKRPGL